MNRPSWILYVTWLGSLAAGSSRAAEPGEIRDAIRRGLPVLEGAAERYVRHRDCFSCHHQTLPMLALVAAGRRGLGESRGFLQAQAVFTRDAFSARLDDLRAGRSIGGRAMTVGYALVSLELGGAPADETTDAMISYLLRTQESNGRWTTHGRRPPLEQSETACTAIATHALDHYARGEARSGAAEAIRRGFAWIAESRPTRQEDRLARLWALSQSVACELDIEEARQAVLATQRWDGGWAADDRLGSDAYATGQTLAILSWTGTPPDDRAFRRGLDLLLRTQGSDGSWFVPSRSVPVQVFFDNGDPHGGSQFISISATAWAVTALAQALPRP